MKLQTVLLPETNTTTEALYWRINDRRICFDTYFNMFSLEKWKRYTILEQVHLLLEIKGHIRINLYADDFCILSTVEKTSERKRVKIYFPQKQTDKILWFELIDISKEKNAELFYGEYGTEVGSERLNQVKLGLDICTYKRERDVERNIELIIEKLLGEVDLKVFIIDNAHTLDSDKFESEFVHLIKNKNYGGTGGFTRGLIEILNKKETEHFTHVIFMDDDARLEPDAIVRTFALLRLLKKEYSSIKIGGAMLRLDSPYIEHAAGEFWNDGHLLNPRKGLDLRVKENCIKNEEELDCEYAGWWYCCMPLTVANENNLPLPMFIHLDDVEYGLRNKENGFLYLNGICIWHACFEHRRPSHFEYYEVRNGAMIRLLHSENDVLKSLKKSLFRRITANILRYRYKDVKLNYLAIEDLCRGIDWLIQQDAEVFHKELLAKGYSMKTIDSLICQKKITEDLKYNEQQDIKSSIKYSLTYNGWFLSSKRPCLQAFPMGVNPYSFYRVKRLVLFNPEDKKGIMVERNWLEMIKAYSYYWKAVRLLNLKFNGLQSEYTARGKELQAKGFWEKQLEIGGEN